MNKIRIKHTGTQADAEARLEEAAEMIKGQREEKGKTLSDEFLKKSKDEADLIVNRIFDNMIEEIASIVANK